MRKNGKKKLKMERSNYKEERREENSSKIEVVRKKTFEKWKERNEN